LHAQEGRTFIQCPMEGFILFRLGTRGADSGEVVPLSGTRMGATSIMACACLPERVGEGCQTLLPRDNGTLSAIKFQLSGKELVLQFGNHC
jgi:hypothetical protein